MRFRLATKPPLNSLKAWFDLEDNVSGLDIFGVKKQICNRLRDLRDEDDAPLYADGLSLSIDDFDLLDDSSAQVIKENDLVCISKKKDFTKQKKRKASALREPSRKKRRTSDEIVYRKRSSPLSPFSTSGSSSVEEKDGESSSSIESSSDSSDSSESDSESSTDSDSESTSSESSVEVRSSKKFQQLNSFIDKSSNNHLPTVPPGEGKSTTHSRNARRRVKRLYERNKAQTERSTSQILSNESPNAIPLGAKATTGDSRTTHTAFLPPATESFLSTNNNDRAESMAITLKNKNKKKGFKKAMLGITAQRIVFPDENGVQPISTTSTLSFAVPSTPATPNARLITPSEKQAKGLLPSNMFVTSVEVENGKWDKKKKKKQRDLYGYDDGESLTEGGNGIDKTVLDYGEPNDTVQIAKLNEREEPASVDWTTIEQKWDALNPVTNSSLLEVGVLVGWKALAINPMTFTPETLVHLGRIKEVLHASSSVVIVPLRRPGAGEIAFGAFGSEEDIGNDEEERINEEEEAHTFDDVLTIPWKLVVL
ncbi:hypothetical protein DFH11DRAFT_1566691 [Phellopilus nigrolimitatus]|nr:hypothetical protein DFH11DRAFT_1566691 [Phellopilus nigrolimitatus]